MKFKNHRSVVGKEKDLETEKPISVPYMLLKKVKRFGYLNCDTYIDGLTRYRNNGESEIFPLDEIQLIGVGGKVKITAESHGLPADYFPKTRGYFNGLEKRTVN